MTKRIMDFPTWKWLVGILLAVISWLAVEAYASNDRRITTLENESKVASPAIATMQQQLKDLKESVDDQNQQLHELLGTEPRKPKR